MAEPVHQRSIKHPLFTGQSDLQHLDLAASQFGPDLVLDLLRIVTHRWPASFRDAPPDPMDRYTGESARPLIRTAS